VKQNNSLLQNLLLIAVIIFAIVLVYKIHYGFEYYNSETRYCDGCKNPAIYYPYPIHADEWVHLAQGIYLMQTGELPNVNPYVGVPHADLESGFHVFIAQIFTMTGLDPVTNYQYLPAICTVMIVLALILLVYYLTSNFYIGLISAMFMLAVKNNINIMGIWFFLPFIFGVFFLLMIIYTYLDKKYISIAILLYLASIFVYPIITVIVSTLFIGQLFYKLISKQKMNSFELIMGGLLILVAIFVLLLFSYTDPGFLMRLLIVKYGWTGIYDTSYSIYALCSIPTLILAIVGSYFVFKKKYSKLFLLLPLIFIIPIMMYTFLKFTPIIPYQRAMVFFSILIAPLAAIAVYDIIHYFKTIFFYKKTLVTTISVLLSIVLFVFIFWNYYAPTDTAYKPYHLIEKDTYTSLLQVSEKYGSNKTFIAPWDIAYVFYPITRNRVIVVPPSNLEYGDMRILNSIYNSNVLCNDKQSIMLQTDANYIVSRFRINCGFLNEESVGELYVYSIK
jgi:hypothetical protein